MKTEKIKLFLVDDDALYLKTLEIDFLDHTEFEIHTFSTGEQCVANLGTFPDVIVLDFHLDGIDRQAMNGIATLDKIKDFSLDIQVIMLSSQDKIEVAVECMHHRAFDYVVKSETAFFRLKKIISTAIKYNKMEKKLNWYMDRM